MLLILATVALNLTIGENGIFKKAQDAVNKYEQAQINEQDELNKAINTIDDYMNGKNTEEPETPSEPEDTTEVEGVTIPKGFYYVGGTKATGIVISDAKADENIYSKEKRADQANIPGDGLVGNQFVWVPVENIAEFKRYPNYIFNGSTVSINSNYEPSQEGYRYSNEVEEYNAMMQSVENNHGFYVARYEAGNEGGTLVSKKNVNVWRNIAWGNSMTDIGTTGAVARAKGMYTNKETHNVTSTLIYGIQWDAIMAWIDPAYKTSTCAEDSFVRNSQTRGNYSGNIALSGSNENYKVKNIYDLAGNVMEWTMEASLPASDWCRVVRGGSLNYTSINSNTASGRINYRPEDSATFDISRFPRCFIHVVLNAKATEHK